MFYGQHNHNLDQKGRIILPSKYRERLGEVFYVTRGLKKCLFVYPYDEWKRLEEKIMALPMSTGGDIQRFFFNNTEEVSADKQGRVLIPQHLREYANLDKDIVISGVSVRLEIWNAEEFANMNNVDSMNPADIASQMEVFGI